MSDRQLRNETRSKSDFHQSNSEFLFACRHFCTCKQQLLEQLCVLFLPSEVVEEQGQERESEDAELKPSEPKKKRIERRRQKSRVMEVEDQSQSQGEEDGSGSQQSEDEGKRELDQGV